MSQAQKEALIAIAVFAIVGGIGIYFVLREALKPIELPPPLETPQEFNKTFAYRHYRVGEPIQFTLIFNDIYAEIDSLKARLDSLEKEK